MLRIVVALCLVGAAVCGPPVSRSRSEIEKFRDFLESSRTEHGVRVGENMSPEASAWENSGKYQGDIILDDEQVESMVEQYAQGRNAYIWPGTHWPYRTVVYEFAGGFDHYQREHILYSMRIIESRTCIRFRHRHGGEFNFVLITGNPDGCYANVGYWYNRGAHIFNLARAPPGQGCFNVNIIIHEWLHILGFFHMQSTYNRYDYVRINWGNIIRGTEHNFDRYDHNMVSNLGLPYEYDSCMHYGPHAFSSNGHTTIDPLRPNNGQMGQSHYVTGYDFLRVDRHYGCRWRQVEDYQPFYPDREDDVVNSYIKQYLANEEIVNEEVANEEIADEEIANEEIANEEIVNEEIVNEEIVNEEIANEQ